jgi:glucose/arabinose dehydrogenase
MKTIRLLCSFIFLFHLNFQDAIAQRLQIQAEQFSSPIHFLQYKDFNLVVERQGTIKYFKQDSPKSIKLFIDISSKIESGGEKGLLGFALHPLFTKNGLFFVNYTRRLNGKLETVISRFSTNLKTMEANSQSEKIFLTFEQPYHNHNGGSLEFNKKGILFISTGDGGSKGDPHNNAQNSTSLLGKIITLDVSKENPKPEIYAIGLRNPWKISFDKKTDELWAADAGQNSWEEINIIEKGKNYGWRIKEGTHCFNPEKNCNSNGLTEPVFEYKNAGTECAIIGGYVYRGMTFPNLDGHYIYGDYCSGKIWAFNKLTKTNTLIIDSPYNISSFGQGSDGEMFVLDLKSSVLLKLVK